MVVEQDPVGRLGHGQHADQHVRPCERQRRADGDQRDGIHAVRTRTDHDQHTDETGDRRRPSPPVDRFRQREDGDDRGEHRLGEHERRRVGERQIDDRDEDPELSAEGEEHAQQVKPNNSSDEAVPPHAGEHRRQQDHADTVSEQGELERAERATERLDENVDNREQQCAGAQPQDAPEIRRKCHPVIGEPAEAGARRHDGLLSHWRRSVRPPRP